MFSTDVYISMTTIRTLVYTVCYCNVDTVAIAESPIWILDLVDLYQWVNSSVTSIILHS